MGRLVPQPRESHVRAVRGLCQSASMPTREKKSLDVRNSMPCPGHPELSPPGQQPSCGQHCHQLPSPYLSCSRDQPSLMKAAWRQGEAGSGSRAHLLPPHPHPRLVISQQARKPKQKRNLEARGLCRLACVGSLPPPDILPLNHIPTRRQNLTFPAHCSPGHHPSPAASSPWITQGLPSPASHGPVPPVSLCSQRFLLPAAGSSQDPSSVKLAPLLRSRGQAEAQVPLYPRADVHQPATQSQA